MENEELDLTGKKWTPENEIYLVSIIESFKDNYPGANIEEELSFFNFTHEDLLDQKKVKKFLDHLNKKFPTE
jgi:hypothetical protein